MALQSPYRPKNHIRVVTAASLFDGHDAAINIMRRILQSSGAEVIHLGHNRAVAEIATSGHPGGCPGYWCELLPGRPHGLFRVLIDLLREYDATHVKVFGGGGGVIVPEEIRELEAYARN